MMSEDDNFFNGDDCLGNVSSWSNFEGVGDIDRLNEQIPREGPFGEFNVENIGVEDNFEFRKQDELIGTENSLIYPISPEHSDRRDVRLRSPDFFVNNREDSFFSNRNSGQTMNSINNDPQNHNPRPKFIPPPSLPPPHQQVRTSSSIIKSRSQSRNFRTRRPSRSNHHKFLTSFNSGTNNSSLPLHNQVKSTSSNISPKKPILALVRPPPEFRRKIQQLPKKPIKQIYEMEYFPNDENNIFLDNDFDNNEKVVLTPQEIKRMLIQKDITLNKFQPPPNENALNNLSIEEFLEEYHKSVPNLSYLRSKGTIKVSELDPIPAPPCPIPNQTDDDMDMDDHSPVPILPSSSSRSRSFWIVDERTDNKKMILWVMNKSLINYTSSLYLEGSSFNFNVCRHVVFVRHVSMKRDKKQFKRAKKYKVREQISNTKSTDYFLVFENFLHQNARTVELEFIREDENEKVMKLKTPHSNRNFRLINKGITCPLLEVTIVTEDENFMLFSCFFLKYSGTRGKPKQFVETKSIMFLKKESPYLIYIAKMMRFGVERICHLGGQGWAVHPYDNRLQEEEEEQEQEENDVDNVIVPVRRFVIDYLYDQRSMDYSTWNFIHNPSRHTPVMDLNNDRSRQQQQNDEDNMTDDEEEEEEDDDDDDGIIITRRRKKKKKKKKKKTKDSKISGKGEKINDEQKTGKKRKREESLKNVYIISDDDDEEEEFDDLFSLLEDNEVISKKRKL